MAPPTSSTSSTKKFDLELRLVHVIFWADDFFFGWCNVSASIVDAHCAQGAGPKWRSS